MSDDGEVMVAQILRSLEDEGYQIRSTSRRGRYTLEAEHGVPVSPPRQLLLDPERVAEYTAALEQQITADPDDPLHGIDGLSLLKTYIEETVRASERRLPDRFGLRRRKDGTTEFFTVGDTILPTDSPVPPGEEHHFTWIATPRTEDQDQDPHDR